MYIYTHVHIQGETSNPWTHTIVDLQFQTLPLVQMLVWGWRVPFIASIIPGTISLMARRHLVETEEFLDLIREEKKKHGLVKNAEPVCGPCCCTKGGVWGMG